MSAVRVSVDRELCCSSGQCVVLAPELFDQRDSDGTSYPVLPRPSSDLHESARRAAADCPTRAISIQD